MAALVLRMAEPDSAVGKDGMPVSTTPTVVRRYVALELHRLRQEKGGISQADAGRHLNYRSPQSVVAKFERGERLPRLGDVRLLLELYDRSDLFGLFQDLMTHTRVPGPAFELDSAIELPEGFDMYLGLEQGASKVFCYDAMTVKGILQCRTYADALIRAHGVTLSDDEIRRRVDLRMSRQLALDRPDNPLELVAVIDESVLHRQIGGPAVMVDQLTYLMSASKRPNVALRVLPYSAGAHRALDGAFTVLTFPIERDPGTVYLQDRIGGRYRDDVPDIDEYAAVADYLLEAAASEEDSLRMIKRANEEVTA